MHHVHLRRELSISPILIMTRNGGAGNADLEFYFNAGSCLSRIIRQDDFSADRSLQRFARPLLLDCLGERLEFLAALEQVLQTLGPQLCDQYSPNLLQISVYNISRELRVVYNNECVDAAIAFARGLAGISYPVSNENLHSNQLCQEISAFHSDSSPTDAASFGDDGLESDSTADSLVSGAWIVILLLLGSSAAFFSQFYNEQYLQIWRERQLPNERVR